MVLDQITTIIGIDSLCGVPFYHLGAAPHLRTVHQVLGIFVFAMCGVLRRGSSRHRCRHYRVPGRTASERPVVKAQSAHRFWNEICAVQRSVSTEMGCQKTAPARPGQPPTAETKKTSEEGGNDLRASGRRHHA